MTQKAIIGIKQIWIKNKNKFKKTNMENDLQEVTENNTKEVSGNSSENNFSGGKNKKLLVLVIGAIVIVTGISLVSFLYFSDSKKTTKKVDQVTPFLSSIGKGAVTCDAEYENLLSANKLDENLCGQGATRTGEFKDVEVKKTKTNIVMIFDSSGSMATKIEGKSKIDIAKNATNKFIENIKSSGANLSVLVYGHKGSNNSKDKAVSCAGIEEVYWFGAINPDIAKSKFNGLNATGWTPIAKSLEMAKDILMKKAAKEDKNIIMLISDGEETCNGDPVAMTKEIKSAGFNIKVNVIGFDVGGTTEAQLRKIAEAGDGQYSSVKNEKDFEAIFQQQENMVNKMDFAVTSGVEQLYDISALILKYNQCKAMLDLEEASFMLNAEEKLSPSCKASSEEKYFKRYDGIKSNLKTVFEKEKNNFNDIVNVKK
ncbi:MAG: VWA domain-containing protein [Candidatus Moraniibacteriota bacterium]